MKAAKLIVKSFKIVLWIVLGIILLPCAVLTILYSQWGQDALREQLLPALSSPAMRIELRQFSLKFPLRLSLEGLTVFTDSMEMVHAGRLEANVRVLPLFAGRATISEAQLNSARFRMGAPDSALYMTISADSLALREVSVRLRDMHISLPEGAIRHGRVDMTINPDTTAADTTATEPSSMLIDVRRLALDDFTYTLRLLPSIDSLGANIGHGLLEKGEINMLAQTVKIGTFTGRGLDVAYIAPDSATVAATHVPETSDTSTTKPWTVTVDSIGFNASKALYTTCGVKPLPGLDFAYIAVDDLTLSATNFYNQAATVRVPLAVSGRERCGVRLKVAGTLDISETGLNFKHFAVSTAEGTSLAFSGLLGMGDMTTDPSVPLRLDLQGGISPADGRLMFPAFTPYLATIPASNRLGTDISLSGTAGNLNIKRCELTVNTVAQLSASGTVRNVFDPSRLAGNIDLSGTLIDVNPLVASVLDPATAKTLHFPRTTFSGQVDMAGGNYQGRLRGTAEGGELNLDGYWHGRAEDYSADVRLNRFPVNAFMPLLGVGQVTAHLQADGHGINPFSPAMRLDADLKVDQAVYQGYDYRGIAAQAHVADGNAKLNLNSSNPNALATVAAEGNLAGDTYVWTATVDGRHIDLHALGLSPEPATVEAEVSADLTFTPKPQDIAAKVVLQSLTYTDRLGSINLDDVTARLNATDSVTNISVHNRDFYAFLSADEGPEAIMARMDSLSSVIASEVASRTIDVERIQQALPQFSLDINAGPDNALTDILAEQRMGWKSLHLTAANDSSISLETKLLGFSTASMRIDTITFDLSQYHENLVFDGHIGNQPGTLDQWAKVDLEGFLSHNKLGMQVAQHDISGQEGYLIGLRGELTDSTASISLDPTDPTIAYKDWTVNEDNYIIWNFPRKHLDANLKMEGNGSSLELLTEHVPGQSDHQEELVLRLGNVHISDWIALNPFAPPMKGDLSADLRVSRDELNGDLNGKGTITLSDFFYNRERVGNIGADLSVATDLAGKMTASADLIVNGHKSITLTGAVNDSTTGSPLAMDLSMIHFPLATVNPFLPEGVGRLRGTLNGQMDVTGRGSSPNLDGWLQFDSTAMTLAMTGTEYPFSDVKIPVETNVVKFNDFSITGVNRAPLTLNGTVDLKNMANPGVDLTLKTTEFQICNTKRAARGADIYGRGFISLDASVRGNMEYMAVNADLSVLSGTNITYVMPDATTAIQNQATGEMVKFVNFADTAAVEAADSLSGESMAMRLEASLTVQPGSTINVDLSADGKNKVSIQPNGTIDFSMMPFSEPRVTGRLDIPKGFVRYTIPVMGEKHFDFKESSYIAFNGAMLNPSLNIHAVDVVKANVTQSGQNSRLINFDVLLSVTGTLEHMDVAFDLSTNDDMTVANELQSMSPDQRANQAMNLLLYKMYTGPGTKGDASIGGNALYSFLTSQLNSWAANNIRGVDLSFGVDQYDQTVNGSTSQTTSYSYQVSKSLFNDRFKIVVGGNYSTDANADENFSQNLIKDISFEYFLNKAQTMYVRIFRHTGYESILEGEITQTGVGFVYKRKLTSIKRMFRFLHRKRRRAPETTIPQISADNDSI